MNNRLQPEYKSIGVFSLNLPPEMVYICTNFNDNIKPAMFSKMVYICTNLQGQYQIGHVS